MPFSLTTAIEQEGWNYLYSADSWSFMSNGIAGCRCAAWGESEPFACLKEITCTNPTTRQLFSKEMLQSVSWWSGSKDFKVSGWTQRLLSFIYVQYCSYLRITTSGSEFITKQKDFFKTRVFWDTEMKTCSTCRGNNGKKNKFVLPFLFTGICTQIAFFYRLVSGLKFWSCAYNNWKYT